jgi:ferredoxin-type protein NapH
VSAEQALRTAPNGRPIRLYRLPDTLSGKLWAWRYLILRRVTQFSVLLLFFATAHWAWGLFDEPLLSGNLSSSSVLGLIPLADPFAVLQILFTRHLLSAEVLIGAAIVLGFYALIGGRVFCSWVCPVNVITDSAAWLRNRFDLGNALHLNRGLRYYVLVLALVLSFITGLAAFEWVSPIAMLHREVIFGIGMGLIGVVGIFLFDLMVLRHGWCGHLCPLGAFYAVVGTAAQLRVRFDESTCTRCGECIRVCPEPQVLNLNRAAERGFVTSGECTNCGRCVPVCPEDSLHFDLRPLIARHNQRPDAIEPSARRTT